MIERNTAASLKGVVQCLLVPSPPSIKETSPWETPLETDTLASSHLPLPEHEKM
ncbi:hypothetical protein O3P69_012925 [Scylla paramamosain]|uniref:Uncharacterized protein n=1 Tax=Scylla paramamosain TaxID=85552 RepID=A0AAW0TTY7_SCYPA